MTADRRRDEQPERIVGLHFFNPAPVLPLVEVVRTAQTSDEVFDAAYAFAQRIGKEPVACNDTPGFIVNRILIPLLNDCVRVLDEARVSPEDVDRAMRFGANWPIGPCALIDLIGVDVHVHASRHSTARSARSEWPRPSGCSRCRVRGGSAARAAAASTSTTLRAASGSAGPRRCSTEPRDGRVVRSRPRS